jgi:hypothetical protein
VSAIAHSKIEAISQNTDDKVIKADTQQMEPAAKRIEKNDANNNHQTWVDQKLNVHDAKTAAE